MDVPQLLTICLGLACLLHAALMLLHAWEHGRFHRNRPRTPPVVNDARRVTLFVPCKGAEVGIEANLRALFLQEHPAFELCFIVESTTDAALGVIEALRRQYPQVACRVVVAGLAGNRGQKVHNLMAATRALAGETEILAFVDSDARPNPNWLTRLVGRLQCRKHSVATGYRWYVPARVTLVNCLLSAVNNTVIGLLGPYRFNLVWGGAWAIRRKTFHELGLPEAWEGSLSDDLVVSRLVRGAGLRVAYEPHCIVHSVADFRWRSACEFLRRQFMVVRCYAPGWWHFGFWMGLLINGAFWGSLAGSARLLMTGGAWLPALALCGGAYLLQAARWRLTSRAVEPFVRIPPALYRAVTRWNVWAWPVVCLAVWVAMLSSSVGRTIRWRGIRYRLASRRATVVLWRDPAAPHAGNNRFTSEAA